MECPVLSKEISYGDIAQAAAVLVAAIAVFVAWLQIKAGNRQKRAEFIVNLYNQFSLNKEILNVYYEIEYNKFEYNPKTFLRSDIEKNVDNLLRFFNNVAQLHLTGNFTLQDLEYISYNYIKVYQNKSIQAYLENLDKVYETRGLKVRPFWSFRLVGSELEKEYFSKL